MDMANQAGTTLRGYGRCPEYSEKNPSDTFSAGRLRTDLGQHLSRFSPDGLGMTCQEHRIRELVAVGMAGRVVVEWAGLAKVHSDQPYLSRSEANAGLVVGW